MKMGINARKIVLGKQTADRKQPWKYYMYYTDVYLYELEQEAGQVDGKKYLPMTL